MGNSFTQNQCYSVPVSDNRPGETEIRRAPDQAVQLIFKNSDKINNMRDIWINSVEKFGNQECVASRGKDRKYEAKTYQEVDEISINIGAGIKNLNLAPTIEEYKDYKLDIIGVFSKNREELIMIDVGCAFYYGMTIVPLYDTLGVENLTYCLNHCGMSACFSASKQIDTLLDLEDLGKLKTIIALDEITNQQQEKAKEKDISIISMKKVISEGKQNRPEYAKYEPTQILAFSYTSGTTGTPKGAMISHENLVSVTPIFRNHDTFYEYLKTCRKENIPIRHLSYLPLPHIFEKLIVYVIMSEGGASYFYGGDVQKLGKDLYDAKPTLFISVPRLYNKFYDNIKAKFAALPFHKRVIVDMALKTKLKNIQNGPVYTHAVYDKVFQEIRNNVFGGRIKLMISGSAPISEHVLNFFQAILSAPLIEGYGQTEGTGASFAKSGTDPLSGHIGGPFCNTEFKLVDIPEMDYLTTDKDKNGNSRPRGEICIRGKGVIQGYYKDEEKTKQMIDEEGWLHSGDVGVMEKTSGRVQIIDRMKNIFKLSQGEYIAPEKIENIYNRHQGVTESFVYGDSMQSYLVGIIVPEQSFIEQAAKQFNIEGSFEELCCNRKIRDYVLVEIQKQGKQDKLFGFEQVKNIQLEPQSLSTKGCFTNTMKIMRHKTKIVFQKDIKKLYDEFEQY